MTRVMSGLVVGVVMSVAASAALAQVTPRRVGEVEGGAVAPTAQTVRPVGEVIRVGSRPIDVALSPDGGTLYVKDNRGIVVVDAAAWTVRQEITLSRGGTSMTGIAASADGARVYVTDAANGLHEYGVEAAGLVLRRVIELPGPEGRGEERGKAKGAKGTGNAYPCGVALSADGATAYVCLSRVNALGIVDLQKGELVEEIAVGVAPFGVRVSRDGKTAVVTNWGGRRAVEGDRTADSSGTLAVVDERGVAASGTASIVDLMEKKEVRQVATGLSASGVELSRDGTRAYVANANADTVTVVDVRDGRVIEQIEVRPDASLPFGSMPNGVALSEDEGTLFVSCAGNNAVGVVKLGRSDGRSTVEGYMPTGWYPAGLAARGGKVYVVCTKGLGSRGSKEGEKRGVYDYTGTIERINRPDEQTLIEYSAQARTDARVPQALVALQRDSARAGVAAKPVPERAGEPSVFDHVVYVIKENRTYDQVMGDMGKGNSEPSLCIFGREVTPNQHALAEQFVLLDNFYCNGVLSADGHSWATEGNVTPYLERSFGGFNRSYTFGDDPLTYSSSGFVWDHVLAAGLTFRNYGEFGYAESVPRSSFREVYDDFVSGERKITFTQKIGVERMRRYACPGYPGWNMNIPDVVRADIFVRELEAYEKSGQWLNFMIVYLPNDHTSGMAAGAPTPRALVADNDLALGRIVEAITRSRFWARTCIFVIEDDPQDGFDHVDGHRSTCLVISPYTKRGAVVSEFYNQTSVMHTMLRILGMGAANQMHAAAPLMSACFTDAPDLSGFAALPARVDLTEVNKKVSELPGELREYAERSAALTLDRPDAIHDDTMNRILWHAVRGASAVYPAEWAGAHGRGLDKLGLRLGGADGDDDDDDGDGDGDD